MRIGVTATFFAVAFLGSLVYAQQPAPPGGIKLLPGYQHKKLQGIDTRVGRIWKEGGLAIDYDIGRLAGNAAKSQDQASLRWSKEQVVDGRAVQFAFTKDRKLFVTFPQSFANFSASVRSEEDLADMLLMVLTYVPQATTQ